jgi:hypothetical protein
MKGCIFAGVTWGTAWWFIARDPAGPQSRRYASAWVILAVAAGIGISGGRGWMQWPGFFAGHIQLNNKEFAPIDPAYGFVWMFIAGMPWAGLGACCLAWTGSLRPVPPWQWVLRIGSGLGMAYFLSGYLFPKYPEIFLPLYSTTLNAQYHNTGTYTNLGKLIGSNESALRHLGFYLGFLLFEIGRRDWKNALLILTVGVVNGTGWALLQSWNWAHVLWPDAQFNFWRCWESSGGISIGIALGVAYFLVNRPMSEREKALRATSPPDGRFSLEWMVAAGVLMLIGWATCFPVTGGLKRMFVRFGAPWWGYLYVAAGLICALGYVVWYFRSRRTSPAKSARPGTWGTALPWLAGFAVMLALGWFIKSQLFGDFRYGLRGAFFLGSDSGGWWWVLGNIYFILILAYGAVCVRDHFAGRKVAEEKRSELPQIGWLFALLSLAPVMSMFVSSEARSWTVKGEPWGWSVFAFGILIAAAFGITYYVRARSASPETSLAGEAAESAVNDPNLERLGACLGLVFGMGLSIKNGLKGWANIYLKEFHKEGYYESIYWNYIGTLMLVCLLAVAIWLLLRPLPRRFRGDAFPHASWLMWFVLLTQYAIAFLVTGPPDQWAEAIQWWIYYLLLFFISALIIGHFQILRRQGDISQTAP